MSADRRQPNGALQALRDLGRELDQPLEPPAGEARIADLVRRAAVLGGAVPPGHLDVLREHDGYDLNGLRIYATADRRLRGGVPIAGLVETNLGWRDVPGLDDHIVLGDGNMDLYAVHLPSGRFEVRARVPGDLISIHDDYADLIAAAVASHRA